MAKSQSGTRPLWYLVFLLIALSFGLTVMLLAPSWWSILSFDPAVNLPASPVSASKTIYNPGGSSTQEYTQDSGSYFPFAFRERLDIENLDPEADELWNGALNTPLGGFLLVAHNETFYRGWGVSMFHSIHCLSMLRTSFQSYFGLATGPGGHGDHTHGSQGRRRAAGLAGIDERQHVEHCMGYIAKALLCNGDDTLEPPFGKFDEQGNVLLSGVSGEGHQHSCRDSSLAWKTVMESETTPVHAFEWSPGDTVRSVFGHQ